MARTADTAVMDPERRRPSLRRLMIAVPIAVAWTASAVVVVTRADMGTFVGRVAFAVMPAVPAAVFAGLSFRTGHRGPRMWRRFWFAAGWGAVCAVVGQIARGTARDLGGTQATLEYVQGFAYLGTLTLFTVAMISRVRTIAAATWVVQFLDAASFALVVWAFLSVLVVDRMATSPNGYPYVGLAQPAFVILLVIGVLGVLFTPLDWGEKRVEWILFFSLSLAAVQAWIEVFWYLAHHTTASPAAGFLLTVSWTLACFAPSFEHRGARPPRVLRDDYATVAWPYLALGAMPLITLWAIWRTDRAAQAVAVGSLVAVFALAVIRQLEVIRSQRRLLDSAARLVVAITRDVTTARALLSASRDLAASTRRSDAEAAIVRAAYGTTGAGNVRILDAPLPDSYLSVSVPGHDIVRVPGSQTYACPVRTADGRLVAGLLAEGPAWDPSETELALLVGFARQLAVALDRADLVRRLSDAEARYSDLLEHLPSGVVELRDDGVVVDANPSFERLCELTRNEIAALVLSRLFTMTRPPEGEVMQRVANGEEVHGEGYVVAPNGSRKFVDYSVREIVEDGSSTGRNLLVMRDITERREQRLRIVRLYQELEAKERSRRELLGKVVSSAEDERRRFAAELHDGPVQTLTALGLRLDAVDVTLDGVPPAAEWPDPCVDELVAVRIELARTVDTLRGFMSGLRPPEIDEGGVGMALHALCARVQGESALRVVCDVGRVPYLPETTETVVYRVAQEALTNVVRHANASEARVFMGLRGGALALDIVDDGIGYGPAGGSTLARLTEEGHFGLATISERVLLAGGRFSLSRIPSGGTRVAVTLPPGSALPSVAAEAPGGAG